MTATQTAKGKATRSRLLAAAHDELVANGGGMELAAVSSRAGVSPGLPYRYFESKSALLVAVVEEFFDAVDDTVYRPTFEHVSDDWWQRERARIEALVNTFYNEPLGACLLSKLAGDVAVAEALERRRTRQVRGASKNVRLGKRLGIVPDHVDHELAGALLMGGVYQAISHALGRSPRMSKRRLIRGLCDFMKNVLAIEDTE